VPVAGVGGALLLSTLLLSGLCLALRPLLAAKGGRRSAFTSIFRAQRAGRLCRAAVAGNLYGNLGLALASVAMVAIIPLVNVLSVTVLAHYASPEKQSVRIIAMTVVRNPLIWACAIGLAINLSHLPLPRVWHEVASALGSSSLAIGLLVTGAGLHLEGLFRPSAPAALTIFLKLILMPAVAVALALLFGVSGPNLVVVVCAPRCRRRRAPMCWPARWAATRRYWRRSSRCRPSLRPSPCRSRLRWWRRRGPIRTPRARCSAASRRDC
jgi:predicted permease